MRLLPEDFEHQLQNHFSPAVVERILSGLQEEPTTSVRLNGFKPTQEFSDATKIPWSQPGRVLAERPAFHRDPLFHAGAYYVQDSSSMILEAVLSALNLPEAPFCLDACAAPGGKSTILLDYLDGQGFLIANEIDRKRNSILQENTLKWGHVNQAVSSLRSDQWKKVPLRFDLILVDAPCSGEGMFRKDSFALAQWNTGLVDQCSALQQSLLDDLDENLSTGGYFIYATCTMNRKENEDQLIRLLRSDRYEIATPALSAYAEHLTTVHHKGEVLGHYLLPGIALGEGLFIAVLRKTAQTSSGKFQRKKLPIKTEAFTSEMTEAFALNLSDDLVLIRNGNELSMVPAFNRLDTLEIPLRRIGLPAFEIKGKNLIPKHGLAMRELASTYIDLELEDALHFLRKETLSLPTETGKGWQAVGYKNRQLGWVKVLDNRTNNYYPGWLRLRN